MAPNAPGERHARSAPAGLLLVLLLVLGVVVVPLPWAPSAAAEPTTSPPGSTATLGQCLADGDVWLHVELDRDHVLRSECVGRPATGLEALAAADVQTTEHKGGYLCTLAREPQTCPSSFNGRYWQYAHAAGADAPWRYSRLGAAEHRPAGGDIEGWCYNAQGQERCVLPALAAGHGPAPRVDGPEPRGGIGPWAAGAVVVVLGAAVVTVRRRRA
ncbi:hypothetical protein [Pimelobacter simplex]|uniref:hypothetical protein n=1 Tax=Nocardioides simplex TaxID=2045 RepID=UPI003AAF632C